MTRAFLLVNNRLDDLHYGALTTMGAEHLIKSPVTLRQPWRQLSEQPLSEEKLTNLLNWLRENAQANDFLVIEGDDEKIEPVLSAARSIGLIAMRPVWQPVAAFVPLIAEDAEA